MPEQHVKRHLIYAHSAAIARAMASICNDEQKSFSVMSGMMEILSASEVRQRMSYECREKLGRFYDLE